MYTYLTIDIEGMLISVIHECVLDFLIEQMPRVPWDFKLCAYCSTFAVGLSVEYIGLFAFILMKSPILIATVYTWLLPRDAV